MKHQEIGGSCHLLKIMGQFNMTDFEKLMEIFNDIGDGKNFMLDG